MKTRWLTAVLPAVLVCGGCFQVKVEVPALASGGVVGEVTVGAEHGAIFYAFDTLAYPREAVDLTARVQSAKNLEMIADVTVGFFRGGERIGSAVTDEDGLATIQWTPPKAGGYEFEAQIIAVPGEAFTELLEITPAPLVVMAWPKDKAFVVVDLDHTVVDSSFFRVLLGGARPAADSVRVMRRIARRYGIVYLTHRPDLLTRTSKAWLRENGYPPGPLLVSELKEAFGDSGKFKTAKLAAVTEAFPNAKIGIGDKLSDAQAYVDNGLVAYLIPHYKDKPESMRKMAGPAECRQQLAADRSGHLRRKEVSAGDLRPGAFAPGGPAGGLAATEEARREGGRR